MNILKKYSNRYFVGAFALVTFMVASCTEDIVENDRSGKRTGAYVSYNVSEAQDNTLSQINETGLPKTRAAYTQELSMQGLQPEDIVDQKIVGRSSDGNEAYFIETTVAGVNPVKANNDEKTRANITRLEDLRNFGTIGYRGDTEATISNSLWFYNEDTKPDGQLVKWIPWSWEQPYGRFYAVSPKPESKIHLSPESYAKTPYVDFEVEPLVKNQKDLMTACSGNVRYAVRNVAPRTDLDFYHALTAIRFKIGNNLSYDKTVDKVEIRNALSKGRYTLSDKLNNEGAVWSDLNTRATFTLGGDGTVNVSTKGDVGNIIMGRNGDNYTFYMIPQTLTDNRIMLYVHFTDGSYIEAPLKGSWKPGTTKTYALSERKSDWEYTLTVTSPDWLEAKQDLSTAYTITSYRTDPKTGVKQPVEWEIVGYEENGIDTKDYGYTDVPRWYWGDKKERPNWLSKLSLESGKGGTAAEEGYATLRHDYTDWKSEYDKVLQDAEPKGTAGAPYNLSNSNGGPRVENTANSYLISAPGYYRIPLVYGNAIVNGKKNEHAYITQLQEDDIKPRKYNSPEPKKESADEIINYRILWNFLDHNNYKITDPWITKSNEKRNIPDGAKIVWSDQKGLVSDVKLSADKKYVEFSVSKENIKNGNAVIAVTQKGTVVWSWHLWFNHADALNTLKSSDGKGGPVYSFTKQQLGFAYFKWEGTPFTDWRGVKLTVRQKTGNGGERKTGTITIQQKAEFEILAGPTRYHFGRKDAAPYQNNVEEGTFILENDKPYLTWDVWTQHPERFYNSVTTTNIERQDEYSVWKDNAWTMDNYENTFNHNPVVKTVYDPCPVGFSLAPSAAYDCFMALDPADKTYWSSHNPSKYRRVLKRGPRLYLDSDEKDENGKIKQFCMPLLGEQQNFYTWVAVSNASPKPERQVCFGPDGSGVDLNQVHSYAYWLEHDRRVIDSLVPIWPVAQSK